MNKIEMKGKKNLEMKKEINLLYNSSIMTWYEFYIKKYIKNKISLFKLFIKFFKFNS